MLKRINMGILGAGNIAGTMAETVNKMPCAAPKLSAFSCERDAIA